MIPRDGGAPPRIGVIDYGMGNRRSVQKALERVGARTVVDRDHHRLSACDGLVLPGVGAFPRAMANLRELELDSLLHDRVAEKVPILGICLGMQLLFERSPEIEPTDGLGIIPGEVSRLDAPGLPIPHIGWNEVRFQRRSVLTAGLPESGCPFYHVHSLVGRPVEPADVIATTEYGERFATVVQRGCVFGVQFHPEKSSVHGLRMLESFARVCAGGNPHQATALGAARA